VTIFGIWSGTHDWNSRGCGNSIFPNYFHRFNILVLSQSFYISEGEYLAPAIFHEEGKVASQTIYSNVRELVEHQQYVFDTLWNKSIASEEKIKAIEDGIQPSYIETIRDPVQIQKRALKLGTMARDEILLLYSTANALYRQGKTLCMTLRAL
jgi:hypothetical protein